MFAAPRGKCSPATEPRSPPSRRFYESAHAQTAVSFRFRAIHYPLRDRLMVIDRTRHGQIGLYIFEAGFLQCSVCRHIQGIGLAKQSLQAKVFEIDCDALSDAFRPDTLAAEFRNHDVQMHECLLAEFEAIAAG